MGRDQKQLLWLGCLMSRLHLPSFVHESKYWEFVQFATICIDYIIAEDRETLTTTLSSNGYADMMCVPVNTFIDGLINATNDLRLYDPSQLVSSSIHVRVCA